MVGLDFSEPLSHCRQFMIRSSAQPIVAHFIRFALSVFVFSHADATILSLNLCSSRCGERLACQKRTANRKPQIKSSPEGVKPSPNPKKGVREAYILGSSIEDNAISKLFARLESNPVLLSPL